MSVSVSQRIPNLLGGVSQQPDSLKLPGQLTQADNCLPDPTYGLLKRPGLKLVSNLAGATANGRWFNIFRDSLEKYIGQFATDGTLRIWNANTGAAMTINAVGTNATNYVSGVSESDFEMLQINDYNFVLNRSKTVAMESTTSPAPVKEALIVVKIASYGSNYSITLDGTEQTLTTPQTGTVSIKTVVSGLEGLFNNNADFVVETISNVLHIKRIDGNDFTLEAKGGLNSTAIEAYKGSVKDVADLPGSCFHDMILKIQNLENVNGDEYYVKFVVDGSTTPGVGGVGSWEETVAPGLATTIDADTMPHAIIRETNGTFTFRPLSLAEKDGDDLYWVERRVGDDNSNPPPSFVGNKVTGMSFFRNRLVLLAGSNVVCSQPSSFFNFFRISALTTSAADSVDLAAGSLKPVDLKYAIGDQLGLLLFSEHAQFMLNAEGDAFGPANARLTNFSALTINPEIAPVDTGTSIIYTDANQGFSAVTEMIVTSAENRPQKADLSRTAPNYVPGDLKSVVSNNSATMVSFLATQNAKELFVFKYFNNGSERVLASWIRWLLPGDCLLQASDHDKYYFVTEQENGIALSTCTVLVDVEGTAVNKNGISYEYRMDLFTNTLTVAYNSANDTTRVFFPSGVYDSTLTTVVVVDDTTTERGMLYINATHGNNGTDDYLEIPGDRTTSDQITLGYQYDMTVGMPKFYRRAQQAGGNVESDVINIPRIQRVLIQSTDSGPFKASVSVKGRTTKQYTFSQAIANEYLANTVPIPEIIDNNIPVYGKGTDSDVTLSSNTPFPLSFIAATWFGTYANRGIRSI